MIDRSAERSLALHAAVGDVVRRDPSQLTVARARVEQWIESGAVHPLYAKAWRDLLARPTAEILEALIERSERMNDLRQVSPFAGALDPRTRWRLLREIHT